MYQYCYDVQQRRRGYGNIRRLEFGSADQGLHFGLPIRRLLEVEPNSIQIRLRHREGNETICR